jgi:hypothetical protein
MASSYPEEEPAREPDLAEVELSSAPLRPFVMVETTDTTAVCGPDGECY